MPVILHILVKNMNFLLDKGKKKILMGEYIKLSKDFLTNEEVKYFNLSTRQLCKHVENINTSALNTLSTARHFR